MAANLLKQFVTAQKSDTVLIPILQQFLLKELRAEEYDDMARIKGVQEDARLSIACFRERIDEFNHTDPRTKDYFHPSQIGQCLRKLWFRHFDAPNNGAPTAFEVTKSFFTFEVGTYFHVLFQNLCQRAGVLVRREFPVVDKKLKIIGHADGVLKLPIGKAVLEIKTINSRGFLELRTGPKKEHIEQANIYSRVLGIPYTIFVYFNKDTSEIKEFRVSSDNALFASSLRRMQIFRESLITRKPPEKEGTGPTDFKCRYCEYSKVCYSTSDYDKFMVILHKKPVKKFNIKFAKQA